MVDFGPETVLESFLGVFERRLFLDQIHMGEKTEDFWESVGLKDIQEFECLLH